MTSTATTAKVVLQYEFDGREACRNLTPVERAAWLMQEGALGWQYSKLSDKALRAVANEQNCKYTIETKPAKRLGCESSNPGVYWRMNK